MRPEKKYLVQEISQHLEKSNYFFLTDFTGVSVSEAADLRNKLAGHGAEFHVIKNRLLNVALKERDVEGVDEYLTGPTALVVGGEDPSGTAKVIAAFIKSEEKFTWKGGVLGAEVFDPEKINKLKDLPSLEVLKAKLLGLLNTPSQKFAGTLNAVPGSLLNVLSQKPAA